MQVHLLYKPGDSKKKLNTVKRLDKIIFFTDDPCEDYENTYWFGIYYKRKYIAFAGVKIQPDDIAFFNRCGVKDKYRGCGLQKHLIKARCILAKKMGAKKIRTYTSLDNYSSINSLLRCGFKITAPVPDLDNGKWLIWEKKLSRSKYMTKPFGPIHQWSGDINRKT